MRTTTHHDEPELVTLVRGQKVLARRNRSVRNGMLLLGLATGLTAAAGWLLLAPESGPEPFWKLLLGGLAGMSSSYGALAILRNRLFPHEAACPRCGLSWEIEEGGHVPPMDQMPNWDRCPGCGTLMNETLLARHLRAAEERLR